MTDETVPPQGEEFGIVMPPNARIAGLQFEEAAKRLRISFSDGGEERIVPVEQIVALHGGRIRHEKIVRSPKKVAGSGMAGPMGSQVTGVSTVGGEVVATAEDMLFVMALRSSSVRELWYLVADSFNFRKALGQEAGYSTEINFRALVRKLAAFAPRATQDGFFAAVLGGLPLPPPIGSLIEFFKTVGKDLT